MMPPAAPTPSAADGPLITSMRPTRTHIGECAITRTFAQRRTLRDAVEQAQRDAPAQVLASVGKGLRGLGVARHRAREYRGGIFGQRERALDIGLGHDGNRAGNFV